MNKITITIDNGSNTVSRDYVLPEEYAVRDRLGEIMVDMLETLYRIRN